MSKNSPFITLLLALNRNLCEARENMKPYSGYTMTKLEEILSYPFICTLEFFAPSEIHHNNIGARM